MSRFNPHAFATAQVAATTTDALPTPVPAGVAFIDLYGRPGADPVPVPEGSTAVTLCLKHNDSAGQVDHFDHHAGLGCPPFLLLLVRKQNQTEALARQALSLCPELQSLDWKWHAERYRGGHGNYLSSSAHPLPAALTGLHVRKTFTGLPVDIVFWEIEFSRRTELWPHRHYGAKPLTSDFSSGRTTDGRVVPVTAAWRLNAEQHGVEIHFTRRPDDAALNPLRDDRAWRYSGRSRCWWSRQTPQTLDFARAYCDHFNGTGPVTRPAPIPAPPAPVGPGTDRKIIRFIEPGTTAETGLGRGRLVRSTEIYPRPLSELPAGRGSG